MARIERTSKLWETIESNGDGSFVRLYLVWCPACACGHVFHCGDGKKRPNWNFNGNFHSPSFTPSLRMFIPATHSFSKTDETTCHFVLTDGKIHYCGDNPHRLNGQVIDMEDIPPNYGFG